jgi:hypothetical protein
MEEKEKRRKRRRKQKRYNKRVVWVDRIQEVLIPFSKYLVRVYKERRRRERREESS